MQKEERERWKEGEYTTCDRCGRSMPANEIIGRCIDPECKKLICKLCHRGNCNKCGGVLCQDHAHLKGDVVYCKSHKPSCFIATAVYGSPNAYQIDVLRDFRDTLLMQSMLGRNFMKIYYLFSPPIANMIAKHKTMRMVARQVLTPFVKVVSHTRSVWH